MLTGANSQSHLVWLVVIYPISMESGTNWSELRSFIPWSSTLYIHSLRLWAIGACVLDSEFSTGYSDQSTRQQDKRRKQALPQSKAISILTQVQRTTCTSNILPSRTSCLSHLCSALECQCYTQSQHSLSLFFTYAKDLCFSMLTDCHQCMTIDYLRAYLRSLSLHHSSYSSSDTGWYLTSSSSLTIIWHQLTAKIPFQRLAISSRAFSFQKDGKHLSGQWQALLLS